MIENPNIETMESSSVSEKTDIGLEKVIRHTHNGIDSPKLASSSSGGLQMEFGRLQVPSSTGDQTVTCGFTPRFIEFITVNSGTDKASIVYGTVISATSGGNIYDGFYWNNSQQEPITTTGTSFSILSIDGNGGSNCAGLVTAFSSTGFTINWQDVTVRPYFTYKVYS